MIIILQIHVIFNNYMQNITRLGTNRSAGNDREKLNILDGYTKNIYLCDINI